MGGGPGLTLQYNCVPQYILNVVFICWRVQQISNQTFDLFFQSLQELKSRVCDLSESENDG